MNRIKKKKSMLKKRLFTGLLLWLAFNFVFCSSDKKEQPESTSRYGGTLIIGVSSEIDTFNPLFGRSALGQDLTHLVLLGLADLNERGEFVPELAESWEHSEDYRKMTYHIRKGMRWSDGMPISAYDVEFTYDVLMDTTVGSPRQGYCEFVKKVTAIDSFTVVFEFTEAYPDQMFDTAGEIVPRHVLENIDRRSLKTSEFGRHPVASGPFMLKKWVSQQYIEIVPNPNYYAERPYLDRVIFKIVPNRTNLFTQLQTGEVDMLLDVPLEKFRKLEENPALAIYNVPGRVYNYIGYNERNPIFRNAAVRRALTLAIDREKIIRALLFGFGKPCVSSFPPMLTWAYNDQIQPLPYDPVKAKEILQQNGWKDTDGDQWLDRNGRRFEFSLITNADNQTRSDVAVIVQEQFKNIGVKANIQLLEWTTMLEDLRKGKFDAYVGGLSTSFYVDPTPIYHSTATNLFNYVGFANPAVDKLIETARVEMNRQKAAGMWKELQELIYRDQPYTYLFWINKIVAVNKKFKNVTPVTLSPLFGLEKWYKAGS